MIAYFWLGLALFSSTLADEKEDVGIANNYIDEVLNNLKNTKELVSKFDPLKVPDVDESKLKIWNLWVYGLSSLERSGDCILSYDGERIKVEANLAVNNIQVDANYKAKAGLIWIKGIIKASLERLAVRSVASFTHEEGILSLEDFKVTHFGKIHVKKITGLGVLLNWALKLIVNGIANKSKGKIVNALENEGAKAIREEFRKIKIKI